MSHIKLSSPSYSVHSVLILLQKRMISLKMGMLKANSLTSCCLIWAYSLKWAAFVASTAWTIWVYDLKWAVPTIWAYDFISAASKGWAAHLCEKFHIAPTPISRQISCVYPLDQLYFNLNCNRMQVRRSILNANLTFLAALKWPKNWFVAVLPEQTGTPTMHYHDG